MKKILWMFILMFVGLNVNCFGATVTRYVNPGSTGGDGTTTALTGANAAYASLSVWESTEQTDLVTAGDVHVVNCAGTTADTTAVVITGWTTGAANTITIEGDNTTGKASTVHYRITTAGTVIEISQAFTIVSNIEVYGTSVNYAKGIQIKVGNCTVKNCIVHDCSGGWGSGIMTSNSYNDGNKIYNNVIYHIENNGWGIHLNSLYSDVNCYNNTIYSCAKGIYGEEGQETILKNNISYGNDGDTDYSGTFCTTSNNLSSDATSPDVAYRSKTLTFTNTGAGTEDFHLVAGDTDAIDNGVDLSGTFTDDIDGDTRTGTWDIGADETDFGSPDAGPMPHVYFFSSVRSCESQAEDGLNSSEGNQIVTSGGNRVVTE